MIFLICQELLYNKNTFFTQQKYTGVRVVFAQRYLLLQLFMIYYYIEELSLREETTKGAV